MSSVEEELEDQADKTPEQRQEDFEEKAGPLGDSGAPSPM
jgi:hypothetical protein